MATVLAKVLNDRLPLDVHKRDCSAHDAIELARGPTPAEGLDALASREANTPTSFGATATARALLSELQVSVAR